MDCHKIEAVCFGALNLDRLYIVDRISGVDEESHVLGVKEFPGGSAANTAVGLARLGIKTGYIGKVARDREGLLLLESFRREGVDIRGVIVSESGRSGVVMGYVNLKGNRALYVDPGVNDQLSSEEVDLSYASSAEIVHLTSFVGDKPFEAQKALVRSLRSVKISLDPGALYARRGFKDLRDLIERCYLFLPNETELKLITGIKDYVEGCRLLLNEGLNVIAVKLGAKGCYVTNGEEEYFIEPFRARVVDTTGAGDAFNAGFIYGLLRGKSLRDCGVLGNYVASRCIAERGARRGLPRLIDIPMNLR
ncbi:TPA: carbohydrate kinase family protein [Candidatus Bathyarchaeota archaeon]|nr:carbohydrate kinase family protein [Candidatus Bathyarchaeota archaeon]